ncbi:DUF4140 domain-containing protein, partial [Omnitrophica bacterium]|nr:DUF4140 domain-containing protein [Candidatus Omnitrophota bacterium]
MKPVSVIALLALSFLFCPAIQAATIEAESSITDVVVFGDRASVTRLAKLDLVKGLHTIRFASLPAGIDPDSLSAKGMGSGKVKLSGARMESKQLENASNKRVGEIQSEMETLTDRIRELQNLKQIMEKKKEFLSSLQVASSDQVGKDLVTQQPSVTDVTQILNLVE